MNAAATAPVTSLASPQTPADLPAAAAQAVREFQAVSSDPRERTRRLLDYAKRLAPMPQDQRVALNRVMGCTAQVWVVASLDSAGLVQFGGDSDSEISRGIIGVLSSCMSGLTLHQVLQVDDAFLLQLNLGALSAPGVSRAAGAANMLESMKRRARALVGVVPRFPSLMVSADDIVPQGTFAEVQAQYLRPDPLQVERLVSVLKAKQIGVVAHFYMDPQVQGVLSSAAEQWPHLYISDSLVMADAAVKMAKAGCRAIAVLGVDFMSENVRAILDEAGHQDVQVYRMSADSIGCSLAEAAESAAYLSFLDAAAATPRSLHVVYINTSLLTKAQADARVPTITCTSSNVVQTVLQAFAQVPDATVWYGPDTYMGRNLATLFTSMAELSDDEIRAVHPLHTRASIKSLLPRLNYFEQGTCIVHHIFGGEVCEAVAQGYGDAYITAHFEVPGELFSLAMAAKRRDMGVVGSTSNILDFITSKVALALQQPFPERLQFVLGTESGMITSIVRAVQAKLRAAGRHDVQVEIVFPVAAQSITTGQQTTSTGAPVAMLEGISILPGPAGGEGCSLAGGCATCPYMRMNSLSALQSVCERVGTPAGEAMLAAFRPRPYEEKVKGRSVAQAGCVPILHMRDFQQSKRLSDRLEADIVGRSASRV